MEEKVGKKEYKREPTESEIREFWDWLGITFKVYKKIRMKDLFKYALPVLTPDCVSFTFPRDRYRGEAWKGGKTQASIHWTGWCWYEVVAPNLILSLFWVLWEVKKVWGKPIGEKNKYSMK